VGVKRWQETSGWIAKTSVEIIEFLQVLERGLFCPVHGWGKAMRKLCLLMIGLTLLGEGFTALAQDTANPPRPMNSFEQLKIQPTGKNGYEEFILAGELLRGNKDLNEAQYAGSTLSDKRKALADPTVIRALAIFRVGLTKPIHSVYTHIDQDTTFPQLALFRNLARTLMMEEYVLLADGKVSMAISSLEDTLRLGRLIQTEALISGLVGIAIDTIAVKPFGEHLGQLSAKDCDRVVALARQWLRMPSGAATMIANEKQFTLNILDRLSRDPNAVAGLVAENAGVSDTLSAEILAVNLKDPSALKGILAQATDIVRSHYDQAIANADLPPWEQKELQPHNKASLAGRIVDILLPFLPRISERYTSERVLLQMLGVHAAVRRYQWEHDALPNSLNELKLGSMAVDPFTGKLLDYKRTGERTYELSSVGPVERDDENKPIPGHRTPIQMPRKP
jgi:hypothetical protein